MLIVLQEKCVACGLCADVCLTGAISQIGPYRIDVTKCSECGECK
ncbi:MAG: 4Fe-4S binding protein, partial [Syntrophomonadaceae bacterium]|nr:4Fe-4S binding protein [Syntrophomonadaceae bacterium]